MAVRRGLEANNGASPEASLAVLRLGVVLLLTYLCGQILAPFVSVLLWSIVLAVMLLPLHRRLMTHLGNRWSAVLIGVAGTLLLVVPTILLATSLASSLSALVIGLQNGTLAAPPPPEKLAGLPLIGDRLTEAWATAANSFPAAVAKYGPMLRRPLASLAAMAGRLAAGELMFVLAFGIAAVWVAYADSASAFAQRMLQLLTGSRDRGVRLVAMTAATIRGVAVGIVGVAVIQTALLAAGFFAIGLPGAGVLTVVVLLLGVVQVPATIVTVPVIAYAFATEPTGPATIFAVWSLVAGLSDNVLKPLMLGRGLEVPMPVILLGVIGGMVASGLVGLFVGPVLLAVAYVLFSEWLAAQTAEPKAQVARPAA